MNRRIVFGHERDSPLSEILVHVQHFSDKEFEVAELSGNGNDDKEIADLLKISEVHVSNIKKNIKKRVKEILRGY
jgi:DNA-binding CsgD family transcriptional regulator